MNTYSLLSKAQYTPSRRSAVGQFLFIGRLSLLSVFHAVGWSWSLSAFFRPIRHVESASELVGQSGHLIILIGCSAGEPVRKKGAERTCYLAARCRASAWWVRATLDPDAADVSRPCGLLSSPLVRRHRLGVYRAQEFYLSKLLIWCLLIVSKVVVNFRYGVGLRDLKYDHAEKGINMCFISTNKQLIGRQSISWTPDINVEHTTLFYNYFTTIYSPHIHI